MTGQENEPRLARIYEIGNRKVLMAGCDRELFLGGMLMCAFPVFAGMSIGSVVFSLILVPVIIKLLRMAAKKDVWIRNVFGRHMFYAKQKFYFAKPTWFMQTGGRYLS